MTSKQLQITIKTAIITNSEGKFFYKGNLRRGGKDGMHFKNNFPFVFCMR
jgi:hypothetical protein